MVVTPVRRTSAAAVGSLVMGLVGLTGWFSLGIPSLLAIILGHRALAVTRSGEVAGRGAAVAGLTLGYLSAAFVVLMLAVNPSDVAEATRTVGGFLGDLFT
jgi:uncharacterized protein DUF4190